jgi:hypothetical protein
MQIQRPTQQKIKTSIKLFSAVPPPTDIMTLAQFSLCLIERDQDGGETLCTWIYPSLSADLQKFCIRK